MEALKPIKKSEHPFKSGIRRIKHAMVHEPIFWPGKFATERLLRTEMINGLEMWWVPMEGLLLLKDGEQMSIPFPNVAQALEE